MKLIVRSLSILLIAAPSLFAQDEPQDVRGFVRQLFFHGVPYAEGLRFDATDVPVLIAMLADRKEESHWPNIVITLGMIGHESAVEPLIRFLESGEGAISPQHYRAKSSTLLALGYLANRTPNRRTLAYLKSSADPAVWSRRNLRWTSNLFPSREAQTEQLTTMAILGLALSGRSDARATLLALEKRAGGTAFEDVTRLALREQALIADVGLLAYDRREREADARRKDGAATSENPAPQARRVIVGAERAPRIITGRSSAPPIPAPAYASPQP